MTRSLQVAKLKQPAAVEDIDFATPRGLDRSALLSIGECESIRSHRNVIIIGPTGVGKTYIACAIANKACRLKFTVRYSRTSSLLSNITLARADGSYPSFARELEKTDLLVLDDWGLYPLEPEGAREIFEIHEDRNGGSRRGPHRAGRSARHIARGRAALRHNEIVNLVLFHDWFEDLTSRRLSSPICCEGDCNSRSRVMPLQGRIK